MDKSREIIIADAEIRPFENTAYDRQGLRETLNTTVIDHETNTPIYDEIDDIINRIRSSDPTDPYQICYVATVQHAIKGMMSMRRVGDTNDPMRNFVGNSTAVEIINAYVQPELQHHGAGSRLHEALVSRARDFGAQVIVVNSGPRYQEKGWKFWSKHYGDPTGVARDLYGPGIDAPVWTKDINLLNT